MDTVLARLQRDPPSLDGSFADHLLAGAPGDLFIPADAAHFDRLQAAGLLDKTSRRTLAYNALAVIGPPVAGIYPPP